MKWFKQLFCRHIWVCNRAIGTSSDYECIKCEKTERRELADYY